jgi:parallel beta-helix repeat protein
LASILGTAGNASSLAGLDLECNSSPDSVLDATGLDHAVYISGVNGVIFRGCSVQNAQLEGILVENSDNVTVSDNRVANNDLAMGKTAGKGVPPCPTFLAPGTPPGAIQCCPDAFSGGPGNFPNDNDDCGEGLHLRGVTNSVVARNSVHDNIGGILVTDETGKSYGNLIVGNTSEHNRLFGGDCGVTLASHLQCGSGSTAVTGCKAFGAVNAGLGVDNNAVIANITSDNGASGTGVFANPGTPFNGGGAGRPTPTAISLPTT